MIVERFPELKTLNPDEQLELASEFAKVALNSNQTPTLSGRAIEVMEKRLDYFIEHPESGISSEEQ